MITKITIKINHDHVKQKTLVPITQKPLNLRLVIIHKSKSIETLSNLSEDVLAAKEVKDTTF